MNSASSSMPKKTPLVSAHERAGARMVDFAGWWMPVQYKGLKEEHQNVRENVGLFDVSHMGEVRVRGPQALATLEHLTTNHVGKLQKGQAQYSLLPNDQGGLVDDIIVYCIEPGTDYLVCVNASNKDKDFQWMLKHNQGAQITDESDQWGQIAVQGPKAVELLKRVLGSDAAEMKSFEIRAFPFAGDQVWLATTGYTGEAGGEVFVPAALTEKLWNTLLEKGADLGVQPIGLGARDTLRTEMKYSLYGHEIDDNTNPYEAGLGWVIKPSAKAFLGQTLIMSAKEKGLARKLVGLELTDKGIPRQGYRVCNSAGEDIGYITSGTLSPSTDKAIGIAYVATPYSNTGTAVLVDIRGRKVSAQICDTPFYKKLR